MPQRLRACPHTWVTTPLQPLLPLCQLQQLRCCSHSTNIRSRNSLPDANVGKSILPRQRGLLEVRTPTNLTVVIETARGVDLLTNSKNSLGLMDKAQQDRIYVVVSPNR